MIHLLLLSGALRAALVLGVGLGACLLLSRAAAATRRFVLVLTLAAAIVVPVASALGPRWTVQAPAALAVFAHESAKEGAPGAASSGDATDASATAGPRPVESPPPARFDAKDAVVRVWLLVALALLLRAARLQLRVRALVRRATPVERGPWVAAVEHAAAGRRVAVRASTELDSPAVTGLLRPTIVIPRAALDWPLVRCRLVLVHELAHVRRRDVLAQALADVACALHWCNPLAWICARRLRVERELAADDAVLAAGVRPSRYAEELLAVAALVAPPSAALPMAERSSLEVRVASILAARLARAPLAVRGTVVVVAVGAALAAAVACTSPEVAAPSRPTELVLAPRAGTASEPAMQRAADDELAALAREWSPELATVIVLDPATGEVLANAGLSAGKTAEVASTVATPPGSTMKPLTIAAALEERAITVDQKFQCSPDPRMYGDKALQGARGEGALDVAHLLAVSSNIGMSHIFDALGGDNLARWLPRFHLGEPPRGIPGATAGSLPSHVLTGSFEGAMLATGAGGLTATPLQMLAAYGAFAGDGVYHAPTIDRGGSTAERLLSPETAHAVMALLEAVVVDDAGTGKAARVDGIRIAGKTGTSEWTAPDGHDTTYASFIGVADLPARRVVALVGIQSPRDGLSGPETAAPAFARLVKRLRGG